MRILIIRAGALGDTLMATPVVTALAHQYPGARIDFLASAAAAPLLQGAPGIGEVLPLRQRNVPYRLSLEKMRLVRRLRSARYDLAVVLEQAPRYYELAERGRAQRVIGFRDTPFDPRLHSIANNLRAAGVDDFASRSWRMLIAPDEEPGPLARELEPAGRPLIGVHVGYGPARGKKNQEQRLRGWPLDNFARVAARLLDDGATIVLTGGAEDRETVARLASKLPPERVLNVAGELTLPQSVWLIRHVDLLLSVDSGPAHIAAAVGTPVVVLWGPGILEQTQPVSTRGPVDVVREAVPCAPCYGTPAMRACRQNICMQAITPDRVIAVVKERVGSLTAPPSLRPPA